MWTGLMLKTDDMNHAYNFKINRFPGMKELA